MPYNAARVTLIVAMDRNRAIGKKGGIPWRLSTDMRHFRARTVGQVVVMGRKTYDSLPARYRPLPLRENWILSRDPSYAPEETHVFHDIDSLLLAGSEREIYVVGGGEIYAQFLPYATRLLITHVDTVIEGADAFFPAVPEEGWKHRILLAQMSGEGDEYGFSIVEYWMESEF